MDFGQEIEGGVLELEIWMTFLKKKAMPRSDLCVTNYFKVLRNV